MQIQNPTLHSVTSSHTREEVTVKVLDEYKCKLDKQCRIRSHKSRTRVSLITFINDTNPTIDIGLNDCLRHGKEVVGRHDIIPIKTEQWISPEAFVLNENVLDKDEFERTHALRCVQMPDNLWVELVRFRTRPKRNYELPLQVRACMYVTGRRVEIRIEASVGGTYFTKLSEVSSNRSRRIRLDITYNDTHCQGLLPGHTNPLSTARCVGVHVPR